MKKLVIKATVFVLFAGLVPSAVVRGDGARPRPPMRPHNIALIDMARVFKQLQEVRGPAGGSQGRAHQVGRQIQGHGRSQIKKETVELKGFKEGSEEYARVEKSLLTHTTQTDAFRKSQQRELIRKEAQIYKTIYLEVSDAVEKYATHFHFTLVLRFHAEDLDTEQNPEDVMRGLNRQVVYYRPSEDITNAICEFLNRTYSG